jgi:tRNA(Arg) A34 adenosine deaminase TadA
MCAAALGKLGIRRVIFGCSNERFGGNGSILSIHTDRSISFNLFLFGLLKEFVFVFLSRFSGRGYQVCSGVKEEEAISLFQDFYSLENNKGKLQ